MGLWPVNVAFDCTTQCGTHLCEEMQTMDAFIGYGGAGQPPPWLISIGPDLIARDARTGDVFDPKSQGYEQDWDWFEDGSGRAWRLSIRSGVATIVRDE